MDGVEVFMNDFMEMGTKKKGQLQQVVCYRAVEETEGTYL